MGSSATVSDPTRPDEARRPCGLPFSRPARRRVPRPPSAAGVAVSSAAFRDAFRPDAVIYSPNFRLNRIGSVKSRSFRPGP